MILLTWNLKVVDFDQIIKHDTGEQTRVYILVAELH